MTARVDSPAPPSASPPPRPAAAIADARLSLRYDGEEESDGVNAFGIEVAREVLRELCVEEHHRHDGMVGLRDLVVPPNFPVGPMGWRPYYGSMDKHGTAGGTGIGQPLREAPFEDDAPPNPDVYRGA